MDVISYELGKKAGGGQPQPINLQSKEITITENSVETVKADTGYDGLSQVKVTVNTPVAGKYKPKAILFSNYKGDSLTYETTNVDTSEITNMDSVFSGCSNIITLDLSGWNTENVGSLKQTFLGCNNLETINFGSNFDTSKVTNMSSLFLYDTKLDDNTLNKILELCINAVLITSSSKKKLSNIGITDSSLIEKVPNLSNYQAFLNAGWTIN